MSVRSLVLHGRAVNYQYEAARRSGVGIIVCPERGLVVRAPRRLSRAHLELVLLERAAWILKHLDKLAARGLPPPPRNYDDGELLPYGGGQLSLRLLPAAGASEQVRCRDEQLIVQLPWELTGTERRERVQYLVKSWYVAQARRTLPFLTGDFAGQLDLAAPLVKINQARSQWGSCNSKGIIHFNWRLMLLPHNLRDYVVAHEVCHLRYLDHSPAFWQLLDTLLPQARELRRQLKFDGAYYNL